MSKNLSRYGKNGDATVVVTGEPWSATGSGVTDVLNVSQSGVAGEIGYISAGGDVAGSAVLTVDGVAKWYGFFPAGGMCGQNYNKEIRSGSSDVINLQVIIPGSGTAVGNIGGEDGNIADSRLNNNTGAL